MEKHHLTISSSDTDLIIGDCLNCLDALGTYRLREYEHFIFYLETLEVSGSGAHEEELLIWLGESHASVVSNHRSSLHRFVLASALGWV